MPSAAVKAMMSGKKIKGGQIVSNSSSSSKPKLSASQVATVSTLALTKSPTAAAAVQSQASTIDNIANKITSFAQQHPILTAGGLLVGGAAVGAGVTALAQSLSNKSQSGGSTMRYKRISYTNTKALKRAVRRLAGFNELSKKTSAELRKLAKVRAPRRSKPSLNAYEIQLASQLLGR